MEDSRKSYLSENSIGNVNDTLFGSSWDNLLVTLYNFCIFEGLKEAFDIPLKQLIIGTYKTSDAKLVSYSFEFGQNFEWKQNNIPGILLWIIWYFNCLSF